MEPEVPPAPEPPAGPAPQGDSPTGSLPPDGGSPPAGPSPSGHPPAAGDVDDSVVAESHPDAEQEKPAEPDYLDDLRRLQAEFENFRKRTVKQQTELLERAAENLVRELLPVLDVADLAQAHGADDQVGNALAEALRKEGLERIDPVGNPFDPSEHDAVMHEQGDGDPEVIETMRAGYRWRGRLLRPAMVKVKGG